MPATPDRIFMAVLCAVTGAVAVSMWIAYAQAPGDLWRAVLHDRNAHLSSAMSYAGAIRALNPVAILVQVAQSTVWPPLNALLLGVLLAPWMDARMGIGISLLGWSMTVVIAALIARRVFADPLTGFVAGTLAAIFTIACPAFRLLGSDVMLEGLGAGLSALGLLLYLRAMEKPADAHRWRWFGFVLTCLFFEKYNYWAMLIAALAVSAVAGYPQIAIRMIRGLWRDVRGSGEGRRLIADPLLWLALLVAITVAAIAALKPSPVMLFGKQVGLYPPQNLTTVCFALVFFASLRFWRRRQATIARHCGAPARVLVAWHVAPVLISFLIPKRLSAFIWFLGTANDPHRSGSHPLAAALFQWPAFSEGFHVATWSAVLVIVLGTTGGLLMLRQGRSRLALVLFPLISACAMLVHPQQQWRFETTWLFGVWICAGIGGAWLIAQASARWSPVIRTSAAAAVLIVVSVAHALQPASGWAARAAIRAASGPSDLAWPRAYLPLIPGSSPVGFMTSFGRGGLPGWTARSACRCDRIVDMPLDGDTRDEARGLAEIWLARTPAERIVVIDAGHTYDLPEVGITADVRRAAFDALATQSRFAHVTDVEVPAFGGRVSLWQRAN